MISLVYAALMRQYFKFNLRKSEFFEITSHAKVLSAHRGHVHVEVEVLPQMGGEDGQMHSGCLFTVFDNVSTATIFAVAMSVPVSVSSQVHYFKPVKVGDTLQIKAKLTSRKGNLAHVEAEFMSKNEKHVVAKGGQTMAFPGGKGQMGFEKFFT